MVSGGLLFRIRDGKRARDELLRCAGCIRGSNEVELRGRERRGRDAESAYDGVDVVLFQK